jgi:hypothetical protein
METKTEIKKLGFLRSFSIYIPAAFLMYFWTKFLIPYLSKVTGQETILFWCFVGLFLVGVFSMLIMKGLELMIGKFELKA